MKNNQVVALSLLVFLCGGMSLAQAGTFAQRHPRRAEVLGRDHRLGNDIRQDRGRLGGHYNQLMGQDRAIRNQEQRDARQNGGYITRSEQHQLNQEENRLNKQENRDERMAKFDKQHPRRAEVLGRDSRLGNEIKEDKGELGGHYNQFMAQDRAIRRQEQRDARKNGGYITKNEQKQINHEENRLNREIKTNDKDQ